MKEIKIAFLGFGNSGKALSKMIEKSKKRMLGEYGITLKTVAITTGSRGNLVCEEGIDLIEACTQLEALGEFPESREDYSDMNSFEVAKQVEYDILIEITPLEIHSGMPAIDHIKLALNRGKDVVTANKGPVAWAYKELKELAESKKCKFYFETAVMDGTPIFNLVDNNLRLCKVLEVSGILNSTTNFILEELAARRPYAEIMKEGKARGFIEADPAMDIEGFDAAAKTAALLNVLMDANINPSNIIRKGIEDITEKDISDADSRGNKIKLICKGTIEDGNVIGKVEPTEIPKSHILANVDGTSSIVTIKTDLMGTISIIETDPEIEQTAYGLLSDILRVVKEK